MAEEKSISKKVASSPTRKRAVKEVAPKPVPQIKNFEVKEVMSNASGQLKGLEPNQKYILVPVDDAKRAEVQEMPPAKLEPPTVRRSLLIVVERNESDK